jgi:hypothetical protein
MRLHGTIQSIFYPVNFDIINYQLKTTFKIDLEFLLEISQISDFLHIGLRLTIEFFDRALLSGAIML